MEDKKWEANSKKEFVKIQVVFKNVNRLWQCKLEETPSGLGLMECFIITVTEPLVSATTDLFHYLFAVCLWVKRQYCINGSTYIALCEMKR